jgi:hypothetical protein
MMDALSDQPAPNKEEAQMYVLKHIQEEFHDYGISEDELRIIAMDEIEKFGSLGSLAAWYAITSTLLIKNTRISVRNKYLIV